MKKLIVLMTALFLGAQIGTPQSDVEEIDFIQSIMGAEKKEVMSQFVDLQGPAADAFWNLYDEYEVKRKSLGKERIDLIKQYAEEYSGITSEQTDALMNKAIKLRNSNNKLLDSYYKKMKKAAGSKAAAQLLKHSYEKFENWPLAITAYNHGAAGMARAIIPATWIQAIAGRNTWWANLVGVLFGVFMYFPTLVEVPIAQTFLSLGMHRGPLLAYLLADPELSLQSILITNSVIGKSKTAVYVALVTLFSTLSGLLFGLWVDGLNGWEVIAVVATSIVVLSLLLWVLSRIERRRATTAKQAKPVS